MGGIAAMRKIAAIIKVVVTNICNILVAAACTIAVGVLNMYTAILRGFNKVLDYIDSKLT